MDGVVEWSDVVHFWHDDSLDGDLPGSEQIRLQIDSDVVIGSEITGYGSGSSGPQSPRVDFILGVYE